ASQPSAPPRSFAWHDISGERGSHALGVSYATMPILCGFFIVAEEALECRNGRLGKVEHALSFGLRPDGLAGNKDRRVLCGAVVFGASPASSACSDLFRLRCGADPQDEGSGPGRSPKETNPIRPSPGAAEPSRNASLPDRCGHQARLVSGANAAELALEAPLSFQGRLHGLGSDSQALAETRDAERGRACPGACGAYAARAASAGTARSRHRPRGGASLLDAANALSGESGEFASFIRDSSWVARLLREDCAATREPGEASP
ncbi:hypothetical protein SAMN05444340_1573, partial [Citreimonas salinaria]